MQGMSATMSTTETIYPLDRASDSLCNLPKLGGMVRALCESAVANREAASSQDSEQFGSHGAIVDSAAVRVANTCEETPTVNQAWENTKYVFDFPTPPLIHAPQSITIAGVQRPTRRPSLSSTFVRGNGQYESSDGSDNNSTADWISEEFHFSHCKEALSKLLQPMSVNHTALSSLAITEAEASSPACMESLQPDIVGHAQVQITSDDPELEPVGEGLGFPQVEVHHDAETEDALNALRCNETLTPEDFMLDDVLVDNAPLPASSLDETNFPSNFHELPLQPPPPQISALNLVPARIPTQGLQLTGPPRKAGSRPLKSSRRPGIYFEGALLCDGTESSNENRSGTNQPSRFCHICLRRAERMPLMACARLRSGLCRKVVCERCFNDFGYNWRAAAAPDSGWTCTHCRKM